MSTAAKRIGRREYGKVEWFVPVLLAGDSGPNPVAAPNGMKPRKAAQIKRKALADVRASPGPVT